MVRLSYEGVRERKRCTLRVNGVRLYIKTFAKITKSFRQRFSKVLLIVEETWKGPRMGKVIKSSPQFGQV